MLSTVQRALLMVGIRTAGRALSRGEPETPFWITAMAWISVCAAFPVMLYVGDHMVGVGYSKPLLTVIGLCGSIVAVPLLAITALVLGVVGLVATIRLPFDLFAVFSGRRQYSSWELASWMSSVAFCFAAFKLAFIRLPNGMILRGRWVALLLIVLTGVFRISRGSSVQTEK